MCDCFDLDCACDETTKPVRIGDVLTKTNGAQWTVIGKDRSGQGFILQGPDGQIGCEPEGPGETLLFPKHWNI